MENSADNKPLGGNNWWAIVESQLEEVRKQEIANLDDIKRNLTIDILNRNARSEEKRNWDICMPIPYSMCKEIVHDAKILDRKRLKVKHFSSYKMNESEEELFDIMFDYGQALGIEEVMVAVKDQAVKERCTKSQKMYLDYIAAINFEDDSDKGLVNLNINLTDSLKKEFHENAEVVDDKNNVVDISDRVSVERVAKERDDSDVE